MNEPIVTFLINA